MTARQTGECGKLYFCLQRRAHVDIMTKVCVHPGSARSVGLPWCLTSNCFLFPDGVGHSQERHEPPPARVHGDVQHEEGSGRADGDLPSHDQRRQELSVFQLCGQQRLREHRRGPGRDVGEGRRSRSPRELMLRPASSQVRCGPVWTSEVLMVAEPGMVLLSWRKWWRASFLRASRLCRLPRCGLAGSLSRTSRNSKRID